MVAGPLVLTPRAAWAEWVAPATQQMNGQDGFTFPSGGGSLGPTGMDGMITLVTTPEPATLALLALGGLGVVGKIARRRRAWRYA